MSHADDTGSRRDFLYVATASVGAVATGAAVWPLVSQMNPSADVQALSSIEVDIADLELGTQITVKWRGKPVFIRRRTAEEIARGRKEDADDLPDKAARNNNIGND
ncbi:MAG: ubiquinol-cytochrome c reductase iron-sulfur subunit, partial [Alphaproteobacteria bacterium]